MQTKGSQGSRGIPKVFATEGNASYMGVMGCAHCVNLRSLTLTGNGTVPLPTLRTLAPRSPRRKATLSSNSVRRFLVCAVRSLFLTVLDLQGSSAKGFLLLDGMICLQSKVNKPNLSTTHPSLFLKAAQCTRPPFGCLSSSTPTHKQRPFSPPFSRTFTCPLDPPRRASPRHPRA